VCRTFLTLLVVPGVDLVDERGVGSEGRLNGPSVSLMHRHEEAPAGQGPEAAAAGGSERSGQHGKVTAPYMSTVASSPSTSINQSVAQGSSWARQAREIGSSGGDGTACQNIPGPPLLPRKQP
jgi:hypothetical protein